VASQLRDIKYRLMVIRDAKMHELAIAESIIQAVQTRTGDRAVRSVRLQVGQLLGVVTDAFGGSRHSSRGRSTLDRRAGGLGNAPLDPKPTSPRGVGGRYVRGALAGFGVRHDDLLYRLLADGRAASRAG
jgi:hypothetical protein